MKSYKLTINGDKYKTKIEEYKGDYAVINVNGISFKIEIERDKPKTEPKLVRSEKTVPDLSISTPKTDASSKQGIIAPIPGLVTKILIKEGDLVKVGDKILILEAMKMESEITADRSGIVKKINFKEGDSVHESDVLVEIE